MVPAPEVHPGHVLQIFAESFFKCRQGSFQGIGVLLAQGVKMQAGDAGYGSAFKIRPPDSQPGTGGAGIIKGRGGFRMFGIDPEPAGNGFPRIPDHGGKPLPLGKGIKSHRAGIFQDIVKFRVTISGGKGMHLPAEILRAQARFKQRAGAGPVEGFFQKRKHAVHGKGFQGQQYPAPGLLLYPLQYRQVPCKGRLVHHKTGGRDFIEI